MNKDEVINNLLYVPFNKDYKVTKAVENLLTNEEFFEECFLHPRFDAYLKKALFELNENDDTYDFEVDIKKHNITKIMEESKSEEDALETWLNSEQRDLYCFLGDAGVGKTTYIHYLQYKYKSKKKDFNIIDIQNAIESVSILGHYVKIPKYNTLYAKASSALLLSIKDLLFPTEKNRNTDEECLFNLEYISFAYDDLFKSFFPRKEVSNFFNFKSTSSNDDSHIACANYAAFFAEYFIKLFNTHDEQTFFAIMLEIFIYLLVCLDDTIHYIITFDNFERYIGVDEIFNKQLTEFVVTLRSIQNVIADNNLHLSGRYKLIIAMRHTSVRMFTSQQVTEFIPHTINLNNWFDASSILKKKIGWYEKNNMPIDNIDHLIAILNDMGECKETLRGLHFKISMLFNYNKRVITSFLIGILYSVNNKKYINKYNYYWNNHSGLNISLSKFAARSIIYRLVLDALREDGFFRYIIVQQAESEPTTNVNSPTPTTDVHDENNDELPNERANSGSKESLGYARKILTILYEHYLHNEHRYENLYMNLSEVISRLFPQWSTPTETFFDFNNALLREDITQVLFYMNYYDVRRKNWLQFIDLQYNFDDSNIVEIGTPAQLQQLIENNFASIKLRITNAGRAYLFFVVYYFEYFSCKSIDSKKRKKSLMKRKCHLYFQLFRQKMRY